MLCNLLHGTVCRNSCFGLSIASKSSTNNNSNTLQTKIAPHSPNYPPLIPTLKHKIHNHLLNKTVTQRPTPIQRRRKASRPLRSPIEHLPRLVCIILSREEINQFNRRIQHWIRIRAPQPLEPFSLLELSELQTRMVEIWQQITRPMEGVMADDVEDCIVRVWCCRCTRGGKCDVDNSVCDCVDREPEGRLVEFGQGADCGGGLEH